MTDPFFETIEDGEWNACVGVQGSAFAYVDGYLEAARILAAAVIDDELTGSRDSLVMPILYNARHGLELALKYTIERLERLGLVQARDGPVSHDILEYWRHLEGAGVIDLRSRQAIAALRPFVESLARIDDDGQQLRYFETREGGRSLDGIAVVNLPLIRRSIDDLSRFLDELTDRVEILGDEHPTGTRTTRCSRSDLSEIGRMMGPHATWRDANFKERKAAVMERFGLTPKAFSNAVDAIRRSRQLAGAIGIETPLTHLSDEKLIRLAERWLEAHPPPAPDFEPRMINAASISLDDIEIWAARISDVVAFAQESMDLEEFADVQTVFYIGRDAVHGEHYARLLEQTIGQHRLAKSRRETVRHIVAKTSMVDGLVAGLRRVGRPSLAARLVTLREAARPVAGRPARRSGHGRKR